jgi:hypothetical protein
VQDLSHLAEDSITATSQAGGNMMSSNATAMTAPGSQPVTPLPPMRDQDTPNLTMSPAIPPSFSGKPDVTKTAGPWNPPRPAWGKTTVPEVDRLPAPVPPDPTGEASAASIGVSPMARGGASGRPAGARTAAASSTINEIPGGAG